MRPPDLVATFGPASFERVADLVQAGATSIRLNTSYMDPTLAARLMVEVRRVSPTVPVVLDLQGAKMRLGTFAPRQVARGDRVTFALAGSVEGPGSLPVPHPELFEQVAPGETIGVDDARLQFSVMSNDASAILTEARADGTVLPRKGVNLVEHPVSVTDLTPADQAFCSLASRHGGMALAYSFMVDGREAAWIRRRVPAATIIGKVERREATENIHSIASTVDAIWVCRGDLGAQLGSRRMAEWLSSFAPRLLDVPVLIAGQVLEHLTHHRSPTRSEVCHLFDLLARGYAGLVLSDETALGVDPASAVRVASDLLAQLSPS